MRPVESSPQGFTGTISLGLTDLIQMVCLSRSDLIIGVTSGTETGSIHIRQGQIRHAQTDTLQGEEAFFEILRWNNGRFQVQPFENNGKATVDKTWEYLLLEAMRSQDEGPAGAQSADLIEEIDDLFGALVQPHQDSSAEETKAAGEEACSPVRVLVVDDSTFFSKKLKEMLEADSSIQVSGTAKNGTEALEFLESGQPVDLITLDIEMPVMPGDTTIKHVMIRHRRPVLIVSSIKPQSMDKIFDFLQLGAVDFFPKPDGRNDLETSAHNLRMLVKAAAGAQLSNFRRLRKESGAAGPVEKSGSGRVKILAVVGAEGSYVDWLRLPLPVLCRDRLVVGLQKFPGDFAPAFAGLIERKTGTKTEHLSAAHSLTPGTFYMGNARQGAEFVFSVGEPSLDLNISGPEITAWRDGMGLWLSRLAEQAGDAMAVYFLSAADVLPEALLTELLAFNVRLVLAPPRALLCSRMVDSISPYADHFPDRIFFSNPDALPEVL